MILYVLKGVKYEEYGKEYVKRPIVRKRREEICNGALTFFVTVYRLNDIVIK